VLGSADRLSDVTGPAALAVIGHAGEMVNEGSRRSSVMPITTRLGTGLAVLVAGGTHLWSWSHGYRNTGVGPPFLVDAALSAVVGTLVLVKGNRLAAWAGSALAAAALLAYAIARTVGLFGFVERAWTPPSLLVAACEAVVLVLLLTEALLSTPAR
jgi:hypothetical protein